MTDEDKTAFATFGLGVLLMAAALTWIAGLAWAALAVGAGLACVGFMWMGRS